MCPAAKHSPAEQEQLILTAAAEVIEQSSLMDFTMSAIAKTAGMSMGSIYKHVQTKEDVLIALDVMLLKRELKVYQQLSDLPLTTPEKLIASCLFDYGKTTLYAFDVQLDLLVGNEAIINRGSPTWVERMHQEGMAIGDFFNDMLLQAQQSGEMTPQGDPVQEVEDLSLGLWALDVGNMRVSLAGCTGFVPPFEIKCPQIGNTKRFINSFDWRKPLDDEGIERASESLKAAGLR